MKILLPQLGMARLERQHIYGISKLEFLGYHVALVA